MQRQRGELVPVGEVIADLSGPVQALRKTSPPARRGFTQADQVNQLVSASETTPDLGFMGRTMALCSLPHTNPGNRTALPGTPVAAEQTFDEAVATYKRGDYATAMRGFRVYAEQGSAEAQVALWSSFAPPFSAARCSGVEPFLARAFTLAPTASSASNTAGFSFDLAAWCRGV